MGHLQVKTPVNRKIDRLQSFLSIPLIVKHFPHTKLH